ncbi:MAG TPA: tRNA (adenosine(37)-N6)-threonylcarbamoyltransferase complex ATPase subunit type 1 TsaE [Planctomycetaceae bacterium]|jgi:tRNA threonylcarbamoyladenosine biosynthesis protein TsaE|nr:tRNA (adenosine(37)-N6)-threonylcarbamoyltransferase complex ATPase subunit type 1 TsaE [Planctomycetaceae bacterium]
MWDFTARDERDTEALGTALGKSLAQGGVVALVGTLGAGKTRLVQSIAVALGADRRLVNSPTFVLIQEYEAVLPVYHCDTYRLRNVEEFLDLGIDEIFQSHGVCLIEWADRVAGVLPPDHLRIDIDVTGPTARRFHLAAHGPKSATILSAAQAALQTV